MRKTLTVLGAVLAFVLVAAAVAAATSPRVRSPETIAVVEHADPATEIEVDTDGSGGTHDTTGDLLTFHNKVFNAGDTKVIGRDLGHCILINVGVSYQCIYTTFLPGGQISVEGPYYYSGDSVLAIAGGTGRFANARGTMLLQARPDGNFNEVFTVLP
jgi:allene oxide cyclase